MAFVRLRKVVGRTSTTAPCITIGESNANRQAYIAFNQAARKALGDPVAVVIDWDAENRQIRFTVASPEDPDAHRIAKAHGRISVTRELRALRINATETRRFPVVGSTRTSITADLKTAPAALRAVA